jgi:hypothetical protein
VGWVFAWWAYECYTLGLLCIVGTCLALATINKNTNTNKSLVQLCLLCFFWKKYNSGTVRWNGPVPERSIPREKKRNDNRNGIDKYAM